jgi:hypothetical protein
MKKSNKPYQKAQTLVEFSLILPAFIFLVVVIFDFGRAVYYYAIGLGLTDADVNVQAGPDEYVGNFNNPTIKVTVSYDFTPVTPFVADLMPCGCNYLTLTSAATMRTEALPLP